MKAKSKLSALVGIGVMVLGFQNCSAPKSFQSSQTSQLSSASPNSEAINEEQDLAAKPVVTCSSFYFEGNVGTCLEYNNHTHEQYGVGNCNSPQLRKAFVTCERDATLIGRCGTYNNLGKIYTYKYAPIYADEALRAIVEAEAVESCKYAGTWEKAGTF